MALKGFWCARLKYKKAASILKAAFELTGWVGLNGTRTAPPGVRTHAKQSAAEEQNAGRLGYLASRTRTHQRGHVIDTTEPAGNDDLIRMSNIV
jgi:hypothetical protein